MGILSKLFGSKEKVNCLELIANGAVLIDVRTAQEFEEGHAKGSTNIPLGNIENSLNGIKEIDEPIVLCCRSGMRSGKATSFLKNKGIENVYNGGSWTNFANNN